MNDQPTKSSLVNIEVVTGIIRALLRAIGEDPDREGIKDTPDRVARFWQEFIDYDPGNVDVTFEAVTSNQLIVVSGIRVWSLCEHHLLPFSTDLSIGYVPRDRVLGLSKIARIAFQAAHRLQIQERLIGQIADSMVALTGSRHVAVLGAGVHLCMVSRGIKSPGTMTTSDLRGAFLDEPELRQEFFSIAQRS